jgi:hemerythrin-like domain-containing protein
MTETATGIKPNTNDMIAVHQVFRDALGCASQLVGSVCGDRRERVETVATFYANVLAFLHCHHEGEDELLWPKLLERAPQDADLVQRIAGQHVTVLAALTDAETKLAHWITEPDIEQGAALAAALAVLGSELGAHLDEEERRILPLAADYLTVEEWGELPAHGMRSFTGDKLWLVLGLIQEQMPAPAVAAMEAHMPPPVREFWTGVGRPQFAEFTARLRG